MGFVNSDFNSYTRPASAHSPYEILPDVEVFEVYRMIEIMPEYNLKTPRKVQKNLENYLERACKKGLLRLGVRNEKHSMVFMKVEH